MKHILIPVDGSDYSKKAIETGKLLAAAFDSDVTLLNVMGVTPPNLVIGAKRYVETGYMKELAESIQHKSESILKDGKEAFGEKAGKVETLSIEGDAAEEVIDYCKSHPVDLIIMGSHGMGAVLQRLIVGSVTSKVLHHVHVPVLVVK